MIKRYSLIIMLAVAGAAHSFAINTDLQTKLHSHAKPASRTEAKYLPMVLDLDENTSTADLEAHGITVWYTRGNMALAAIPEDLLAQQASEIKGIRRASMGTCATPNLNVAVPFTNTNLVLEGAAPLQRRYDGKGILVGFSDIGFDATHPAFTGRVVGFTNFDLTLNTSANLLAEGAVSDCNDYTHATHVAGILAGDDPSAPYRGVARGSMIYATTSTAIYDANVLCGVEEIISYAKQHDMPAVINLSIGNTTGPHDGTGAFTRYLDLCSADATILLSAGNDGNSRVSARKKFSTDETTLSVGLDSGDYNALMKFNGSIDVWADNSSPVLMRVKIWNIFNERYDYISEWVDFEKLSTDVFALDFDTHQSLNKFFKGTLMAAAELDDINGRYNVAVRSDLTSLVSYPDTSFSNLRIVLEFCSSPSSGLWVYAGNGLILSTGSVAAGITAGNSDHSISDLATGFNTMAIGSSTTRVTAPAPDGREYDWANFVTPDEVSRFSSYGMLADGRRMPHFCAPGAYIVSAANSTWVNAGHTNNIVPTESKGYYMADCGTSMASPHAAGIMALWLEANPELTPVQLRRIAIETAIERGVSLENPRTGAGLIDALAGIRRAIEFNGVVQPEVELATIYRDGSRLVVEGIDSSAKIAVYDMTGRSVSPAALPASPVIVRITSAHSTIVRKI